MKQYFCDKPVRVIPNCLSINEIHKVILTNEQESDAIPKITFVGWIIPAKGVLELVEAVLKIKDISFTLEIIGPSFPGYLEKILVEGARLGDRLLIRGELSHEQTMQALSRANMLVLPSYTEGFPNVVLEAMALSKPIVATEVGAIAEMLAIDSIQPCGIVVPPKDVDALSDAIKTLLLNEPLGKMMGEYGRNRFTENFSSLKTMQNLKDIWLSDFYL